MESGKSRSSRGLRDRTRILWLVAKKSIKIYAALPLRDLTFLDILLRNKRLRKLPIKRNRSWFKKNRQ